jgi:hypothetical protein
MSVADFFNYLLGREQRCEFALQFAHVHDDRGARTVTAGR